MFREIAFHGVYLPSLTLVFMLAMGVIWAFDRWLSSLDLYRHFWHPALLRLCLFVCICAAMALPVYR